MPERAHKMRECARAEADTKARMVLITIADDYEMVANNLEGIPRSKEALGKA